jgi:hypothetical protein
MVFQQFSSSHARSVIDRAVSAALLSAAAVACSGTDIGYPRVSAVSVCATGGDSPTGGSDANSAGSANAPTRGSGGVASAGGSKGVGSAGGSVGGSGASSGGANTGGVASQGGASMTGGLASNGGQAAGGTSGAVSGGAPTNGGTTIGGMPSAGSATGGALGTGFQWPSAYDAAAAPTPADGHHNPGTSCMSSVCHGTKVPFVYGGTVYKADGVTGAANVQVGIFNGTSTLVTYTAANGNIWLPSSAGAVTWTNAVIAIRNKNGERVKPTSAPREAACNGTGCHNSTNRLIEP